MSEKIVIEGKTYQGDRIPVQNSCIMVIQGEQGMLGCGYLSVETADKLGHALAIVTGVASFEDMLNAKVVRLSAAAATLGVEIGMSGREALKRM